MRPLLTLAALLSLAAPAVAQMPLGQPPNLGEQLEIGTSTTEIAIASDFRGADLTVFGSLDNADDFLLAIGQYDIVVALEGPNSNATVRKKERVFGIWINRQSLTFENAPESYSISSTRTIDTIGPPENLAAREVGIDHISLAPIGSVGNGSNLGEFREAFRRLKQADGLYQRDATGVRFVSPTLFKATLRLPASIPNGVHTVRAYLFKTGKLIAERQLPLRVTKTGLEQAITDAAHEQPYAYGLFAVLLAVITGWSASILFRRD